MLIRQQATENSLPICHTYTYVSGGTHLRQPSCMRRAVPKLTNGEVRGERINILRGTALTTKKSLSNFTLSQNALP